MRFWFLLLLSVGAAAQNVASQVSLPGYAEGAYTIKDFHFRSGDMLPELRLSYVTVGTPLRNSAGQVRNAVLAAPQFEHSNEGVLAPRSGRILRYDQCALWGPKCEQSATPTAADHHVN